MILANRLWRWASLLVTIPLRNDAELEQSGLRIFVEDALVEPLDGRTLDVREGDGGPELIFR